MTRDHLGAVTAALALITVLFVAETAIAEPGPQRGPSASRDWWFGARAGRYFDIEEPALGVEILTPITGRFYFNPNVEFVLVDRANYITFNGDFHYDLPTEGRALFWLGAGLAAVYFDPEGPIDSDTDLGGNFLAGLGYNGGSFIPYVQAKLLVTESNNEFVLVGGIRF